MALLDSQLQTLLQELLIEAHRGAVLPEPLQAKMVDDLAIQLEQYTYDHVVKLLTADDQVEFYRLLGLPAEDDSVTVQQFLVAHIPHYDKELEKVYAQFKADYLAICQQ